MTNTSAFAAPGLDLYTIAVGHYRSHALALVVKLGIADLIGSGQRTAQELARATQTDAPSLRRVLRLLASVGVFAEDEQGHFSLTDLGKPLQRDVPGSTCAMINVFASAFANDAWRELEYCVRTGNPWFKKNHPNGDPFSVFAADPALAADFDKAMSTFAPQTAAAVAASYDFSRFGSVVDVGGGNGTMLAGILSAHPGVRGVLFDRPDVIERARAQVAASPVAARVELAPGDFFEAVPGGHDAYMMKHVIHDWNDRDANAILQSVREAAPAHATLLILEGLYPARVDVAPAAQGATANDVNMLVCTGGRQRSEEELRTLLTAAGFALTRVVPTPAPVSVIEACVKTR